MVIFDSAFTKGPLHPICEDYAFNTAECAVLSDGCSGGVNTHIGATILCHQIIKSPDINTALRDTSAILNLMQVDPAKSLLCTSIKINSDGDVNFFGDGVLIQHSECFHLHYGQNPPYYPYYDFAKIHYPFDGYMDKIEINPIHEGLTLCFSDGITAITDEKNRLIPTADVINEFLNIKYVGDGFLKRRLNWFLKKDMVRLGWKLGDDLSVIGRFWDGT